MIIHYELALLIAAFAFTYTYLLTRPDQIFNGLYNRLDVFFKNDERHRNGKPTHPLFMIIIGCEKCFGGQCALWLHLALNWQRFIYTPFIAVLTLILFVAFTIFAAGAIKEIWLRYLEK